MAETIDNKTKIDRPEFIRPAEVKKYFSISRAKAYDLMSKGKIKSVSLRERGQKHGTRLISYDSLSNYLNSLMEGGEA